MRRFNVKRFLAILLAMVMAVQGMSLEVYATAIHSQGSKVVLSQ